MQNRPMNTRDKERERGKTVTTEGWHKGVFGGEGTVLFVLTVQTDCTVGITGTYRGQKSL